MILSSLFSNLFLPPLCLHCEKRMEKYHPRFCEECLAQLTLLPPEGRCQKCFTEISLIHGTCQSCRKRSHPFKALASCFDGYGPAASLLKALKQRGWHRFADDLAAYMLIQLDKLQWPMPTLIIPIPLSPERHLLRGFNQRELIGQALAKRLSIPCRSLLKREGGGFSSHLLSLEQRAELPEVFSLKKKTELSSEIILLIDDLIVTRATMRRAGEALKMGGASSIYGITGLIVDS